MKHRTGRFASVVASSTMLVTAAGAQQPATPALAEPASISQQSSKVSDQLETVVVTAQKRKEDASKVPLSLSVIRGDDLTAEHVADFADITRSIPNVSFSGGGGGDAGNGPGLSNIEMRGISSSAGSATVGVYLDDVSMTVGNLYSMGSAEPKFFDLDHVEVLRGPQGTLYGASSMGGTVKFMSNQPDLNDREVDLYTEASSTKGGHASYVANTVFNQPLIPGELALRVGVESAHQGGYIDQVAPASGAVIASGINSEDDAVVHAALKWVPSKNLTLTPAVMYQKVSTGDIDVSYTQLADGTPLPNNRTAKLVREPGRDQLLVPSLTVNYGMDFGDLTSVSSYFQRKFTRTQDGTTVNSPYLGSQIALPALAATVAALPSAVYLNNQIRQFSQEVRVASKPYDASVSPVTWLVGAYAANLHTSISDIEPVLGVNAAFAAAGVSITDPNVLAGAVSAGFPNDDSYTSLQRFHDQQQSVFGEANYYFTPGLHVTAGLRYLQATELFQRDAALYYANNGSNDGVASSAQNTRGTKATPKLALTWEASRTDTLYASASEGFRLGGGNVQIPETYCGLSAPNPLSYHSDSLWSYEVGDKSRFLNNRLSVNSSLFYVNWKDLQQQIVLPACGYAYNTNVGTAASYGAEVEVKAKPATGLEIDAALGLTHATLTNNAGAAAGIPGAVDGANVPGVPKFNLALSGSYNFSVTEDIFGFVRAAAHWTGSSNGALSSANPDYQRPAYSTVDASTGLSWDKWELSLFVKNLANNQKIIQRPEVQGTANEAYRIVPRTFGISLSAKF